MGTRGLTMVISKGKTKVAQYGQWDHYPEGQGVTILNLLRSFDLKKLKAKVDKLKWATKEQIEMVNATKDWQLKYPYLSRDCGGKILDVIYNGKCEVSNYPNPDKTITVDEIIGLNDSSSFAADSLFCEFAYVIDFDKKTFEIYEGFNKEVLNNRERFAKLKGEDGYEPVKLLKKYSLDKLPTEAKFLKDFGRTKNK